MKKAPLVTGLASVSVFYRRVLSTPQSQSQSGRFDLSRRTSLQLGRGLKAMASTVDPFQDISRIPLEDFSHFVIFCLPFARWRAVWDTQYPMYDILISLVFLVFLHFFFEMAYE